MVQDDMLYHIELSVEMVSMIRKQNVRLNFISCLKAREGFDLFFVFSSSILNCSNSKEQDRASDVSLHSDTVASKISFHTVRKHHSGCASHEQGFFLLPYL